MAATKKALIMLPHAHLRQSSRKVSEVTPAVRQLVADMEAITLDWEVSRQHEVGVALAAVQVDKLLRVIVVRNNLEDKTDPSFTTLINPVITKREGPIEKDYEGCLSVPDIYGHVPRYHAVRVKAQDLEGSEFRVAAEGFLARILQHEIDHTNGVLFIDHIKGKKRAFFRLNQAGKLEAMDYDKDIAGNKALWS